MFLTRILTWLIIYNANKAAKIFGIENDPYFYKGKTPIKMKKGKYRILEFTLRIER